MVNRFFIVPSGVVADYVKDTHRLWLNESPKHNDSAMRVFRISKNKNECIYPSLLAEEYEDKWEFFFGANEPIVNKI
jgi:hypothetical protein